MVEQELRRTMQHEAKAAVAFCDKVCIKKGGLFGSAINTEIWCLYCFINSAVIELLFEDFYFVTFSSSLHLLLRPRACKFLNLCLP